MGALSDHEEEIRPTYKGFAYHNLPVHPFTNHEPIENVNNPIRPDYYRRTIKGVEVDVIDIIQAWELSFCLGNALKYILRAGRKDDRKQDLNKAIECISRDGQ
jgi:hypothetical protein